MLKHVKAKIISELEIKVNELKVTPIDIVYTGYDFIAFYIAKEEKPVKKVTKKKVSKK